MIIITKNSGSVFLPRHFLARLPLGFEKNHRHRFALFAFPKWWCWWHSRDGKSRQGSNHDAWFRATLNATVRSARSGDDKVDNR